MMLQIIQTIYLLLGYDYDPGNMPVSFVLYSLLGSAQFTVVLLHLVSLLIQANQFVRRGILSLTRRHTWTTHSIPTKMLNPIGGTGIYHPYGRGKSFSVCVSLIFFSKLAQWMGDKGPPFQVVLSVQWHWHDVRCKTRSWWTFYFLKWQNLHFWRDSFALFLLFVTWPSPDSPFQPLPLSFCEKTSLVRKKGCMRCQ